MTALTCPTCYINPSAITANAAWFASLAPMMAVVKADGFGHGMLTAAKAALAGGASALGVTSIQEAAVLREAGFPDPILAWLLPPAADLAWAVEHSVQLAVTRAEQLEVISQAAQQVAKPAQIHLFLDLGTAREAAPRENWVALMEQAARAAATGVQTVGLMGHLPCADDGPKGNLEALEWFKAARRMAVVAGLRSLQHHVAGSSGALHDPAARLDAVRIGAGLVGIDPAGVSKLAPAMKLSAPVIATRRLRSGEAVGYGHTWRAKEHCNLATIQIGYADGVPRGSQGAQLWLGGKRRDIVGRISMDQLVCLLGADQAQPGDEAIIFGDGQQGEPTMQEWATWSGTIAHEIVTGIGPRVRRLVADYSVEPVAA